MKLKESLVFRRHSSAVPTPPPEEAELYPTPERHSTRGSSRDFARRDEERATTAEHGRRFATGQQATRERGPRAP